MDKTSRESQNGNVFTATEDTMLFLDFFFLQIKHLLSSLNSLSTFFDRKYLIEAIHLVMMITN